jgi:lysophospholipase L1-like esterase
MFTNFFKSDIVIANHGESGESYVSSLGAHRFDKVWSLMKPGDYLITQFGHNDSKVANALQVYVASMKKVVDGTKKAGGTLILVTPVSRAPGAANLDAYAAATRQMGKDENVPVIDLYALSQTLYGSYGDNALSTLFCNTAPGKYDTTHHGPFGSYEIAKCVVSAIQQSKSDLAKHIVDGFSFDPAKPDKPESFKVPPSLLVDTTRPLGE